MEIQCDINPDDEKVICEQLPGQTGGGVSVTKFLLDYGSQWGSGAKKRDNPDPLFKLNKFKSQAGVYIIQNQFMPHLFKLGMSTWAPSRLRSYVGYAPEDDVITLHLFIKARAGAAEIMRMEQRIVAAMNLNRFTVRSTEWFYREHLNKVLSIIGEALDQFPGYEKRSQYYVFDQSFLQQRRVSLRKPLLLSRKTPITAVQKHLDDLAKADPLSDVNFKAITRPQLPATPAMKKQPTRAVKKTVNYDPSQKFIPAEDFDVDVRKKKDTLNTIALSPKTRQRGKKPAKGKKKTPKKDDAFYTVKKIVDDRGKGKKKEYRVRWEGYKASDDTWEPLDNLMSGGEEVQDMVDEYEANKLDVSSPVANVA